MRIRNSRIPVNGHGRLITLILSLAGLGFAASALYAWTPEYNLTPEFLGPKLEPSISIDNSGRVHCAFIGQPTTDQNLLRFYYQYRDGNAWSALQRVPSPDTKAYWVDATVDSNGLLHMVGAWRWNGSGTAENIYYWTFNGVTWTGPDRIGGVESDDSHTASDPHIAIDRNGDVHVVWTQGNQNDHSGDIMYRKRQAGVWQEIRNLTDNPTDKSYGSVEPEIVADRLGNTIHLVWHDDCCDGFQVYYTRNTNLGDPNAWLPTNQWTLISTPDNSGDDYGKDPHICLDGNNYPNIFWTDKFSGGVNVLAYRRWDGANWTSPQNLGERDIGNAAFDAANRLHFNYRQIVSGTVNELFYEINFSGKQLISAGGNTSQLDHADFALDPAGNPHALWSERKQPDSIAYTFYSEQIAPTPPPPTGTIAGVVRDPAGLLINGLTVSVAGVGAVNTNASGQYSITAPAGTHRVYANKSYYVGASALNVVVNANQTTTVDLVVTTLPPAAVIAFTATPANGANHLTWKNPASGNCAGAMIRFKTSGYPVNAADGDLAANKPGGPSSNNVFDHSGLTNGVTYYYAAFSHDGNSHFGPPANAFSQPYGLGDHDHDGDTDQIDFGHFQSCLSGSTIPQPDPNCQDAKFDIDDDVDQNDFSLFATCLSGPNVPTHPACGQ